MDHRHQVYGLPIVCAKGHILVQLKAGPCSPKETENDCEDRKSKVQPPPNQETQASKESAHVRHCVLSPVSKPRDIGGRWGYESRAEGDSVQVLNGGEEYTASNGKSPEGKTESEDYNVRQSLYVTGNRPGGILVSRFVR